MKAMTVNYELIFLLLIMLLASSCTEKDQKRVPEGRSAPAREERIQHQKLNSVESASLNEEWKVLNNLISSNADEVEISENLLEVWRLELAAIEEMDESLPLAVDSSGNDQIPREALVSELNRLDPSLEDRLRILSALGCNIGPETMFSLFGDRPNFVPSTWQDVAILRAIGSTLEELKISDPAGARSLAAEYIDSKNPVYRYLALQSTIQMLSGENPTSEEKRAHAQELLPLYRRLVGDSDPLIQNTAYQAIGVLGSEEGLKLLENQFEDANAESDPRRRLAIRRALEVNRSLLRASQTTR